jgi:hypothetical protein
MSLLDSTLTQPLPNSLRLGSLNEAALRADLQALEAGRAPIGDEQIWTYLCACGYACLEDGPTRLASVLMQCQPPSPAEAIWLEPLTFPPRLDERNSYIDLATGAIAWRTDTKGGIHFASPQTGQPTWAVFVEAKLYSDIACRTKNDPMRNQLLRVIETGLTFCCLGAGQVAQATAVPDAVHIVLLTPRLFRDHPGTRYYGCKFRQYEGKPQAILEDLALATGAIRPHCPLDLTASLKRLHLHWVTYEEVIHSLPDWAFKSDLLALARRAGSIIRP